MCLVDVSLDLSLVSVIIPACNSESFISSILSSVLSQTCKNIEFLVVDDGSQDKTVGIVKSFAGKDKRVVLQQSNAEVAAARNLPIHQFSGEYIAATDTEVF